ncbi:hypothetical protein U14_00580 [Candidatus Moduliflexus flocculans]|uniref:Type 4 fimbrial biogenesis protein PilX N-terminal domain-containing protein n=1 Tax=Candidatus Moduliflexus flocculans TaxID=1499966 RepID=A0A0S6VX32_9BACT|nr:hypothetical protein U14_00580 [Candidatus Moduliflexus flocculans]
MVVVLSAIIYLTITLLLLLVAVETQVSYSEQRSMQAFFGAESFLALGIADVRALNGEWQNSSPELITFGDELTIFYTTVLQTNSLDDSKNSLYCGWHEGNAFVSGPNGMTKRRIREDVSVKPFTLFAAEKLVLQSGVKIVGHSDNIKSNVHGNVRVKLDPRVSIEGNVTSSMEIECSNGITCPENDIKGKIQRDCALTFPQISEKVYFPEYMYQGKIYKAEALGTPERILLSPKDDVDPPVQEIHQYRKRPMPGNNPAGVFFADAPINDDASNTLSNFDIEGTLILRGAGNWNIKGIVKITAVEQFPAILKFSDDPFSLTYIPYESIKPFLKEGSDMNETNHISGLIYSTGDVTLISDGVSRELVNGSIFAKNIKMSGNPQFLMRYNLRILTDSPPGFQLVERLNWWEVLIE